MQSTTFLLPLQPACKDQSDIGVMYGPVPRVQAVSMDWQCFIHLYVVFAVLFYILRCIC